MATLVKYQRSEVVTGTTSYIVCPENPLSHNMENHMFQFNFTGNVICRASILNKSLQCYI